MPSNSQPQHAPWFSIQYTAIAVGAALVFSLITTQSNTNKSIEAQQKAEQILAQQVALRFHEQFTRAYAHLNKTKELKHSGTQRVHFYKESEESPLSTKASFASPHTQHVDFEGTPSLQVLWHENATEQQPAGTMEVWVASSASSSALSGYFAWLLLALSAATLANAARFQRLQAQQPLDWTQRSLEALACGNFVSLPQKTGHLGIENAVDVIRSKWSTLLEEMQQDTSQVQEAVEELSRLQSRNQADFKEIAGNTQNVAYAAGSVKASVSEMAEAVSNTSIEVKTVAAGADKMSTAVGDIATSVVDMNSKVNDCSTSAIALSKTLAEVATSGENAAQETARAQDAASRAYEIMGRLQKSAEEIDNVIEIISAIAAKTNLLALNAAIEAASAGSSGSGFAVVAGEVKNLANQTAKATSGVMDNVEGIRRSTREAAVAIEEIVEVIDDVKGVTDSIATAVSHQKERAEGMAAVILEATKSAEHIRSSVEDIHDGVRTVAGSATEISSTVEGLASQLSCTSADMDGMVENIDGVNIEMSALNTKATQMDHAAGKMKDSVIHLCENSGAFTA